MEGRGGGRVGGGRIVLSLSIVLGGGGDVLSLSIVLLKFLIYIVHLNYTGGLLYCPSKLYCWEGGGG